MVTQLGMSEKLGPRTFGKREEMVFLGREIHEQVDYSDLFAEEIDAEVRRFIQEAHENATRRLTENRETLDKVAEFLIENETAEDKALDDLFSGAIRNDEPEAIPADD